MPRRRRRRQAVLQPPSPMHPPRRTARLSLAGPAVYSLAPTDQMLGAPAHRPTDCLSCRGTQISSFHPARPAAAARPSRTPLQRGPLSRLASPRSSVRPTFNSLDADAFVHQRTHVLPMLRTQRAAASCCSLSVSVQLGSAVSGTMAPHGRRTALQS